MVVRFWLKRNHAFWIPESQGVVVSQGHGSCVPRKMNHSAIPASNLVRSSPVLRAAARADAAEGDHLDSIAAQDVMERLLKGRSTPEPSWIRTVGFCGSRPCSEDRDPTRYRDLDSPGADADNVVSEPRRQVVSDSGERVKQGAGRREG